MKKLLAALLAVSCYGAITYDNSVDAPQLNSFPATQTNMPTLTVGCSSAVVFVHVVTLFGSAPTVTVNGVAGTGFTQNPYNNPNSSGSYSTLYYVTGVASGSATIVVTNTAASAQTMASEAVSYCGASGVDVHAVAGVISGTLNIGQTTTVNHDWGLIFSAALNSQAAGSGTTQRVADNSNSTLRIFAGDSNADLTPPGAYSLNVSITGAPTAWGWFVGLQPVVTAPSVTTTVATSITSSSALSGGNVTSDGGGTVTARGTCWGLAPNPTSICTSDGTGLGSFISTLSGSASTTYYYRAYATNGAGTSYGVDLSFTTNAYAPPTNVHIESTSNTQAKLVYNTPNNNACSLQVSEASGLSPLVHDVDPGLFLGADQDNRPLNLNTGSTHQFIIGKRDIELANTGPNAGRYFSRALEASTHHYYSLNCPGGVVIGDFYTTAPPLGSTFAESFQGDLSNPGNAPYPYLDPTTRNSFYIDPQTGLRHTAVTFAGDYWNVYTAQTYSDAADMASTWTNPTNVYGSSTATTATSGTGNLWIGVRSTGSSNTYDFTNLIGPSYDDLLAAGSNGSINQYQVSIQAQVATGTDVLQWCLTADRSSCATPLQNLTIGSTLTTYTLGAFNSVPNGANGGTGADPVLFNATPPVNRWHAYTHTGTLTSDGAGNLTWASGNYFDTSWAPSSSFLRLSSVSTANACTSGTAYNVATLSSGILLSVSGTSPTAGTWYYCANNFGVLIKRQTPDSRTVTLENAKFNIAFSGGPLWISTSVIQFISGVQLNGGYYFVLAPSTGPHLLYFFNTTTGVSTLIGPTKPNSNTSGSDQWVYNTQPGSEFGPFDDVSTTSAGHLVFENAGTDINGKQIIIRTDLSGTPAYQLGSGGTPGNALMDETGATITHPTAYSVQVVNHGMTALFTNITPASLGHDLTTQMAAVPGYNTAYMTTTYAGIVNGKLILQGRGNQNTISVFAALDPTTGLIGNYTDTWTRPGCRWCINHSGVQVIGNVSYMLFGTDAVPGYPLGVDGAGPWITQTTNAIASSPSVTCPANSIGAPTTGTACDTFTLASHGGSNPYEPFNPSPGPDEITSGGFLQTAQQGDTFCVNVTASESCSYYLNEIMVFVSRSGSTVTMWRPGNLNVAGTVAIPGTASKDFFTWCTGLGTGIDSNGVVQGTPQGGPAWDTTTSGTSAVWYRDLYYVGGHAGAQFNFTINGNTTPGIFVEQCEENIYCSSAYSIPSGANGYRVRKGTLPGILSTAPGFSIATSMFAGALGNDNAGSHLDISGLSGSFTDDRPFQGDGLGITWTLVAGTSHVYVAGTAITLNRKQMQTAAVAGPHVLKDISGSATGNQITDSTDFSYCVVLFVNECRTASTVGQVYVSASKRTYLGCYNGQSSIDIFAPGGNVQEDICVFPAGNNVNSILQFGLQPDPVGWKYGTVLTYLAGHNKMTDAFANVRVFPDSSWVIGNERWGTTFRNEVVAIKMPPLSVPPDSLNRSTFIPVIVKAMCPVGATGLVADFGYAEDGSDAVNNFYGTSRQENTVANQSAPLATPFFYWASESFSPLSCTGGSSYKLTIPGISGRVLYYRLRHTLSGATISMEPPTSLIVP